MFKSNDQLDVKIQDAINYYNIIAYSIVHNLNSHLDYRAEIDVTYKRVNRLRYKKNIKYKYFRLVLKVFGKRIAKLLV